MGVKGGFAAAEHVCENAAPLLGFVSLVPEAELEITEFKMAFVLHCIVKAVWLGSLKAPVIHQYVVSKLVIQMAAPCVFIQTNSRVCLVLAAGR